MILHTEYRPTYYRVWSITYGVLRTLVGKYDGSGGSRFVQNCVLCWWLSYLANLEALDKNREDLLQI
jgi:hypothetical protein